MQPYNRQQQRPVPYHELYHGKRARQDRPLPGREAEMTLSSDGAYVFEADPSTVLDRFLILGSDQPTYYASARKLTQDNARVIEALIREDAMAVVERIAEVSDAGRAPNNNPALMALAMCVALAPNSKVRNAAMAELPRVARIPTHLFHFLTYAQAFGQGWGRSFKRGVANWFTSKDVDRLAYLAMKYKQRDGWALNDVLQRGDLCVEPVFADLPLPREARRSLDALGKGGAPVASTGQETGRDERSSHLSRLLFDACFPEDAVRAHRFHWENYRTVIVEINFARALFNSFVVTVSVTFGMVFTSSLAAFAFARLSFTGRDRIFLCYLATMMIPAAVTMIPVFILMRELRWVNTYYALIFPGMFSAYGTFMLRQFFMGIPRELEEAAILDGCSIWGIYRHVVIPLSRPALAALTILTFMGAWRGFMWPLIVTNTREMFTLPVALAAFKEMHGVRWTLMMAGSVIMIVPMLIVFVFGQRYFIEGIKLGAIKG